jgi:hypothetical protein
MTDLRLPGGILTAYARTDPEVSKALKLRNLFAPLHSVTSQKNTILNLHAVKHFSHDILLLVATSN